MRDLGDREAQNIFELEIDEIMADNAVKGNGQLPVPKALNSLSPRPSSFTVPIGGEGFTDSFFRLLDFLSKSAEMPQSSS
jgi:hypothetical protein